MEFTSLAEARASIDTLLKGYHVFTYRPEGVTPPAVLVETADPYISRGQSFGEWAVNLTLTVLIDVATNSVATRKLDESLEEIIELLRGAWTVETATAGIITIAQTDYVSAAININSTFSKE